MKIRERIFARDKGLCQCAECKASSQPKPAGEVDHIVPISDGGTDDDSNLQSLSVECHERKSLAERRAREAEKYAIPQAADSPLDFLVGVMNDPQQEPRLRVRAAVAAAQYLHVKKGDGGKKDERHEAAGKAASGRFKSPPPPKLVVNNA